MYISIPAPILRGSDQRFTVCPDAPCIKQTKSFLLYFFLLLQIRNALKEEQTANVQLRAYIDGILFNIMEKYPELLEVKSK